MFLQLLTSPKFRLLLRLTFPPRLNAFAPATRGEAELLKIHPNITTTGVLLLSKVDVRRKDAFQ